MVTSFSQIHQSRESALFPGRGGGWVGGVGEEVNKEQEVKGAPYSQCNFRSGAQVLPQQIECCSTQ